MLETWLHSLGLDWRVSLLQECWFYFRTCRNWRAVIQARRRGTPLSEFVLHSGARIQFTGAPPFQIFQEVWRYKQYTPSFFHGSAPRTVVDIGANIGIFTLYARQQWHDARIVAFEPAPENFALLQENLRSSPGREIEIRRAAIAKDKGTTDFYLKRERDGIRFLANPMPRGLRSRRSVWQSCCGNTHSIRLTYSNWIVKAQNTPFSAATSNC
jgi:hypothetical protein